MPPHRVGVFEPFWAENRYRLCPFWSGIGYDFRENFLNYGNVWTRVSFEFQICKKESKISELEVDCFEIGSGFWELGGIHPPPPQEFPGVPPLPPSPDQTTRVVSRCGRTLLATVRNSARQRDLRVMGLFFRFSTTSRGVSRKLKRADSRRAYYCADECNVLFLLGHIRSYDSDSVAVENELLGFIYLESGLSLFARNAIKVFSVFTWRHQNSN